MSDRPLSGSWILHFLGAWYRIRSGYVSLPVPLDNTFECKSVIQ